MSKLHFLVVAGLAAGLSGPVFAQAQYPDRPLRAIVAFGTGGATDVIARIIATSMSQSLGQPVVMSGAARARALNGSDSDPLLSGWSASTARNSQMGNEVVCMITHVATDPAMSAVPGIA